MADNLTNTAEDRTLGWLTGQTATAPVLPLVLRLMTNNGTDSATGSEVTTGYGRKNITFGAPANGVVSNDTTLRWDTLSTSSNVTVVGIEIWDSATTPVRWFYGALERERSVTAGDPCEFVAGAITLTLG